MRTLRSRRVLQDGLVRAACLILDGARIAAVQPWESAPVGDLLDAQDLVVMPSLVDIAPADGFRLISAKSASASVAGTTPSQSSPMQSQSSGAPG